MLEALEVTALTLPVTDLVLDEFQRCRLAEIRHREDRREDRLQSDEVALLGQQVHLQKSVIGLSLDLDQIGDLGGGIDLRKVDTLGGLACPCSESVRAALKRIVDHILDSLMLLKN